MPLYALRLQRHCYVVRSTGQPLAKENKIFNQKKRSSLKRNYTC